MLLTAQISAFSFLAVLLKRGDGHRRRGHAKPYKQNIERAIGEVIAGGIFSRRSVAHHGFDDIHIARGECVGQQKRDRNWHAVIEIGFELCSFARAAFHALKHKWQVDHQQ